MMKKLQFNLVKNIGGTVASFVLGAFFVASCTFVTSCTDDHIDEGLYLPLIVHNEVQDVTRTSVLLSGRIEGAPLDMIKECGFLYSTSSNFPEDGTYKIKVQPTQQDGNATIHPLSQIITDLKPNTHYYFATYAVAGPSRLMSDAGEFTTLATVSPTFSPLSVDSIGENVMKVSTSVLEVGDEFLLECGVQYKSEMMDTYIAVPSEVKPAEEDGSYTVYIKDLQPSTTYLLRAYAKNSASEDGSTGLMEGYGEVVQQATHKLLAPEVNTWDGSAGMTSITISGIVKNADGSNGVLDECGFCYSMVNKNPTIADESVKVSDAKVNVAFKATLTGLAVNTTYYVRAYARNTVDGLIRYGYGEVKKFTTLELEQPGLNLYDATSGLDTIAVKGRITNYEEKFLSKRGFLWSADNSTPRLDNLNGVQNVEVAGKGENFETTIRELRPNKPYYVRAYAVYESDGTQKVGYSSVETIWTKKEDKARLEMEITPVDYKSVKLQGVFKSGGNVPVIERGFCWMKGKGNLTVETGNKQVAGAGFDFVLNDMAYGEIYSARAYVICLLDGKEEVVYSDPKEFTSEPIPLPTIKEFKPLNQTAFSGEYEYSLVNETETEILESGLCVFWKDIPENPVVENAEMVVPGTLTANGTYISRIEGMLPATYYFYIYVKIRYKGIESLQILMDPGKAGGICGNRYADLRINSSEGKQKGTNAFVFSGTIRDYAYAKNLSEVGVVWYRSDFNSDLNDVTTRQSIQVNEKGEFETTIENLEALQTYQVRVYVKQGDKNVYSWETLYFSIKRGPEEGDSDYPNKTEE